MDTNNAYQIQIAKAEDIPQIVAFAFQTYKAVELQSAKPDLAKIIFKVTNCVVEDLVFVARKPDNPEEIVGCMVCSFEEPWWSTEVFIRQLFVFVLPEYRNKGVFSSFLDYVKEYAIINNVHVVQDFVGSDYDKKTKFLKTKGYEQIGTSLCLDRSTEKV